MELTFTVPGRPQPKQRPRLAKRGRHAFVYTPKETLAYEAAVASAALKEIPETGWRSDMDYRVSIQLVFENNRLVDLDNCIKSVLDGLNNVLWADDSSVCWVSAERQFDAEPCARVQVRAGEPTRYKKPLKR